MKIIEKVIFYTITIFHIPWTVVRVFIASVVLVDAWCDKVINGAINEAKESDLK